VAFTVYDAPLPTPAIASLSPAAVIAGSGQFGLAVSGTGFLSTTTGLLNGTPLPTTFISPTQVIMHVPDANVAVPGTVTIRLQNPTDGSGAGDGISNPAVFSVVSNGASGVQLIVTAVLARDGNNNAVAQLTIANMGSAQASQVTLTDVKIGGNSAGPVPVAVGAILPRSTTQMAVSAPVPVGSSGAMTTLTVKGTYSGGTFTSAVRSVLP
jgi:hypothetical protein